VQDGRNAVLHAGAQSGQGHAIVYALAHGRTILVFQARSLNDLYLAFRRHLS
jgi:hypothetical protein